MQRTDKTQTELSQIFEIIQDGDFITRLGNKIWSRIIKNLNEEDKRFSHVGIVRVRDDEYTVIHVAGTISFRRDYVREEPLLDFLKIASNVGVFRTNDADGSKISDKAIEYVGVPYDWSLDMLDDSRIYCTELIYLVLKRIDPSINLNTIYVPLFRKEIIPIEAISNSEHFTEVFFYNRERRRMFREK